MLTYSNRRNHAPQPSLVDCDRRCPDLAAVVRRRSSLFDCDGRCVLEKLGMQREALRANDHAGRNGEPTDEVVYALTVSR
jgi:hypothetical protein